AFVWDLLDRPGEAAVKFALTPDGATAVYRDAVAHAKKAGLPWAEKEIVLTPSPQLGDLVRRSQELAASQGEDKEGGVRRSASAYATSAAWRWQLTPPTAFVPSGLLTRTVSSWHLRPRISRLTADARSTPH